MLRHPFYYGIFWKNVKNDLQECERCYIINELCFNRYKTLLKKVKKYLTKANKVGNIIQHLAREQGS